MTREFGRSGGRNFPGNYSHSHDRTRRLLLGTPVCVAVALSVIWLAPYFILALKDNLQSNPDGLRGIMPLAVIMGTAVFLVVLACAAGGAVLGFVLQSLAAKRPAARSRAV
jgi:Mg/Co/Ni transporter MgtE